ncbi:Crp/Fnr family transcriptional regulator [Roseospira navarrensis]|uniref:Cyclic nucleotide-binding domain-containing protein n=1 Tax=Roseospira navarrensis TaxID=140058 RepID=A0A7X1ZF97_9PROT|nr:Crp/Fnr family transcriptional regulator [Roseospira navarrensis]MQX37499.1 cyclic nucleotide-binding domain-containing protein [Roseospira navarrensis]
MATRRETPEGAAKRPPGLAAVTLFGALAEADRAAVERQCRWRLYAAHEQIVDREAETRDVHFVATGTARIMIYTASGREVALDDVEAGGFFGELAAFDGEPRSASVMAVCDSWIAALPATRFLAMLEAHPAVSMEVMRRMSRIIRAATDRIVELSTLGANNRVQAEVLRQALAAGADGDGRAVISPIPIHADIASRVSTTRETVARVLNDLARQGFLSRERAGLVVHDVARLELLVQDLT